jgi:c(7)-type cytochrome triheme protein
MFYTKKNVKLFSQIIFLSIIVFFSSADYSVAVPPGKSVVYEGGGQGTVTFRGTTHHNVLKNPSKNPSRTSNPCRACHPTIFYLKKGTAKITMKSIYSGKFCGVCHNGIYSFNAVERSNCKRCHEK